MLTCDITVAVMKIFLILTGQNVAVHLVTCDSGLVSVMVLVAEDRGLVGAVTSDQGWCRDSRGLVGTGDKRVNITAFSSRDRVGKFLEVTLPQPRGL